MPRSFLIDTDTASDDAVALIMALRAPEVEVVAITTVAGNVPVEQSTRNALYVLDLCNAEVPVYMGADKPLLRVYQNATWFHGRTGLGITIIQSHAGARNNCTRPMPSFRWLMLTRDWLS